jgi:colicin import membrane protein
MSMKKTLLAVLTVLSTLLVLPAAPVLAQPSDGMLAGLNVEAERARIDTERKQVEAKFKVEEAACYKKFAVNDCINEHRAVRRTALADLRRQEISLNDAERKRKGAEQIQRMEEKQKTPAPPTEMQQRERKPAASQGSATPRTPRDPNEPRAPLSPRANPRTPREPVVKDPAAAAAMAAEEQAQYQRKLDEAAAHKAQTLQRNAERTKPRAQPLPPAP